MPPCGGSRCSVPSTAPSSAAPSSSGAIASSRSVTAKAFGFYASGDYQFARRWLGGIRYDDSERADNAGVRDRGQAYVLTYKPSEFSQIRGQYRRIRYGDAETANEGLFQFLFLIGAHGAHPF